MHLILTGATGLVGSAALHRMLNLPSVTQISILSRRPVPQAEGHAKAQVIIHQDFTTYPSEVLEKLKGAEGVVWALGVSQNAVSKEKYEEITVTYPLAAAKAFQTLSDPFKFIYVSGAGATTTPSFLTPLFGRIKGIAENALLALHTSNSSFLPISVRAAAVDPTYHAEIHPFIPGRKGWALKAADSLLPVLRAVYKPIICPTRELGVVLVDLAAGNGEPLSGSGVSGEGRTIENEVIRRLGGL